MVYNVNNHDISTLTLLFMVSSAWSSVVGLLHNIQHLESYEGRQSKEAGEVSEIFISFS